MFTCHLISPLSFHASLEMLFHFHYFFPTGLTQPIANPKHNNFNGAETVIIDRCEMLFQSFPLALDSIRLPVRRNTILMQVNWTLILPLVFSTYFNGWPSQFVSQTLHEELTTHQEKHHEVCRTRPSLERIVSQEEEKAKKARMAQERRAKIMAQMSALQKAFIKENAELLASMETDEYVQNFCSSTGTLLLASVFLGLVSETLQPNEPLAV